MPIALEFLVHYAYGILFLWVLIEQLGVPIPSVPLLLTVGTLTATHQVHAVPAMLSILLACLLADSLWYGAGVRYGGRVVRLVCRLSLEASTCVRKTESYFGKHGSTTLLFAKFVPGLSAVAPPIAGQVGMPYWKFVAFDMAGSLLWASVYVFGGRFFGDLAKQFTPLLHLLARFGPLIFVVMMLAFIGRRVLRQRAFLKSLRESRIDAHELQAMLANEGGLYEHPPFIVDLRHPLDYLPDPRVLPGAVRISPAELESHCEMLPRDRDVVLYCTCPSEETSASLARRLQKLGVHRVRPLKGGFEGWRAAGLPLVEYDETSAQQVLPALREMAA